MKPVYAAAEAVMFVVVGSGLLSVSSDLLTQPDTIYNVVGLLVGVVGVVGLIRLVSKRARYYFGG